MKIYIPFIFFKGKEPSIVSFFLKKNGKTVQRNEVRLIPVPFLCTMGPKGKDKGAIRSLLGVLNDGNPAL